jgi:2-isopropylmalate synthase
VDLTAILANVELKLDHQCLPEGKLEQLTNLSRTVWEYIGQEGPMGQPFVGTSAFAHKGGVHVSAVQRNPATYEHVDPSAVGNARKILISELSGGSNLKAKLANRYPGLEDNAKVRAILEEIQDKEHSGYSFESADGSFDLVVRKHLGEYRQRFEPLYYRIYSPSNEEHTDSDGLIEASVKVDVDGDVLLCAAEGNGPVDALNKALLKALLPKFPELADLHLTDYSVKVINSTQETAAKVRVNIEHRFQDEAFGTIGVNVDIIKASWNALIEAYEHVLLQHQDFVAELP